MKDLVYRNKNFEIYDTPGSLVVVNTKGKYRNHAHLSRHIDREGRLKLTIAKTLIDIVIKRKVPKSSYLLTSAIRLTTNEEYRANLESILEKRRAKKYVNVNKGARKK